jgi:hypothetical protein
LRAQILDELDRHQEAYLARLRSDPHAAGYRPRACDPQSLDLRHGTLLLGNACETCLNDTQVAGLIARLHQWHWVMGWPLTAVVADHPSAAELARQVAQRLGLPLVSEGEWSLHVALEPGGLCQFHQERGLTLALGACGLGPRPEDAPDIVGVYGSEPFRWSGGELPEVCSDPFYLTERQVHLRAKLQPRPGWRERLDNLPRPRLEEVCQRLRRGDGRLAGLLRLLSTLPRPDLAPRVRKLLRRPTLAARAADCLGEWGDRVCAPKLQKLSQSEDHRTVHSCLQALAKMGAPEAEEAALSALLQHPGPAFLCLAALGSPKVWIMPVTSLGLGTAGGLVATPAFTI